tara:strand:- start:45 stop:212 length:168 start_codon:yes stop_codon:yes gene_type:complete
VRTVIVVLERFFGLHTAIEARVNASGHLGLARACVSSVVAARARGETLGRKAAAR